MANKLSKNLIYLWINADHSELLQSHHDTVVTILLLYLHSLYQDMKSQTISLSGWLTIVRIYISTVFYIRLCKKFILHDDFVFYVVFMFVFFWNYQSLRNGRTTAWPGLPRVMAISTWFLQHHPRSGNRKLLSRTR